MIMTEHLATEGESGQLVKSRLSTPPHTLVHGYRMHPRIPELSALWLPSMPNSCEMVAALLIGAVPHLRLVYRIVAAVDRVLGRTSV